MFNSFLCRFSPSGSFDWTRLDPGAYYVSSSRYIPKASPIFRALVSGDIAVMVLQNVAVVQVVWGSGTGLEAWLREFQGD